MMTLTGSFVLLSLLLSAAVGQPEECCPSEELMCSSLSSLQEATLSSSGTSGNCSVGGGCTRMDCQLQILYSGLTLPFQLRTTLLPCSRPLHAVAVEVSSPLLGSLVNDTFSNSSVITVASSLVTFQVHIVIVQHCYGLTLSTYAIAFGQRLGFIDSAEMYIHCPSSPSCVSSKPSISSTGHSVVMTTSPPVAMITSSAAVMTTATPSGTPTVTVPPPEECCPSEELMCSSLSSMKEATLSSSGTSVCDIDGVSYEPGDRIPLGDPCSLHCICTAERRIACSLRLVLCESPPSCQDGLLPVSDKEPGQCCPTVTCENTTCLHEGTHYRIGQNIPTNNSCHSCECTNTGAVLCASKLCGVPEACHPELQLLEDKDQCCSSECGCVVNGSGKSYSIGDAIPHENPCTGCRCTDTGIRCFSIQCDIPDCASLGLEVVCSEGQCCPGCGCRVNGISYNVGDDVCDRDPCTTCVCTDSGVQCSAVGCPLIGCGPGTCLKSVPVPGQCCPHQECVSTTCEYKGRNYTAGPVPTGDPCTVCECTCEGVQCLLQASLCAIPECGNDTSYRLVRKEGECCPQCRCDVDGRLYDQGQAIPQNDSCVDCICAEGGKTCSAYGCPLLGCIPGTVLMSVPVPGQCCPNQTCVPDCPPTCSKSYCRGDNKNAVCSRPSGSDGNSNSCLRPFCAVTTCKACYYNANHRPLPGGCVHVSTCEAVKNKPKKLAKCLKKWGQCIGKKDKAQYGKVLRSNRRQRNFKCYSYPC